MSNKDTMRKSRVEGTTSKNPVGRSQSRSKTQLAPKGEETKNKIVDKKTSVDRQSKSTPKTSSTSLSKKNGSGEPDGQSQITVKSQNKVPTTLRSNNVGSTRGTPKVVSKNSAVSVKLRTEKRSDSEKRGISSIYMPKTSSSRIAKSLETTESSTRTEATSSRTKISTVKSSTKTKEGPVKPAKEVAVKAESQYARKQRLPSRERRKSRTLSPSEVKVLRSAQSAALSNSSKAAIPNASKVVDETTVKSDLDDEEYVYEDDFEDYESDFEECTESNVSEVSELSNKSEDIPEPIEMRTEKQKTTISSVDTRKSDEERMLDSGHYELAEARRRAAQIESVSLPRHTKLSTHTEIIVQPIISPYREERSGENKSLPSSTDEGFEDARSGDFAKSPPHSRIAYMDFHKPVKDNKPTKPVMASRGKKLLEMIKLDTFEWSILESKPIAYEEFIRTHGKLNTRQICIQTNEDNLDVETQTDTIEMTSKWTQFPAKCRSVLKNSNDVKLFNMERLGAGAEDESDASSTLSRPIYDILQLNDFLRKAGKVMLSLLEERQSILEGDTSSENVQKLPFSESVVKLSIDSVTFLSGRPVTIIHYSDVSNRVLLTIHAPGDDEIETARDEDFVTDCSIGCVWNILQPSRPMKLFYSSSAITACCFHSMSYNVVLAGLDDGSISLWDLSEDETWHRRIVDDSNKFEWIIRSATFSSIGSFDMTGHDSEVVALRVLSKIEKETSDSADTFMPIQICSLDANGLLIVWSVLRNLSRASVDDLGLSWWGDLKLVKSQVISLHSKKESERNDHLKCFSDMHVDRLDTNALYIATNTTNVMHATRIGKHATPPVYKSNETDWCGDTLCIENCPFDQPYFLVGCADGTVRLHSTTVEKPLLQLKHDDCKVAIKIVQWSRSKPLTIYVLDIDSKIHIWDLGSSDMFPMHTISVENWSQISSMQLSPCKTAHEMINQYMALASDNGRVEVHRLKEEFYYAQKDALKREMNTFLRYVSIL